MRPQLRLLAAMCMCVARATPCSWSNTEGLIKLSSKVSHPSVTTTTIRHPGTTHHPPPTTQGLEGGMLSLFVQGYVQNMRCSPRLNVILEPADGHKMELLQLQQRAAFARVVSYL